MKELEMLRWFERLQESNPEIFGGFFGFAIGFAIALLIFIGLCCADFFQSKKNEKAKGALALIGEKVSFKNEAYSFCGMVASVDFDLDESGTIEATIFVEVDGVDHYIQVNYKEFNKHLFMEGE